MTRYRAEPAGQILREPLGPIDALYHRRSGETHLVAAPVPQILEALGEEAADVGALLERLSAQFEIEGDAAALDAHLAELVALGLVHRTD